VGFSRWRRVSRRRGDPSLGGRHAHRRVRLDDVDARGAPTCAGLEGRVRRPHVHRLLAVRARGEGSIDVAAEFYLHEWDWKAPKLLVEEAGGRYTIEPGLYVASNAALHDEVIALLRA
jgi:hypothetical protein